MTSSIPKQSAAGFFVAIVIIAVGVYFDTKLANRETGLLLVRLFSALAVLVVLKSVLIWGEVRGFPIRRSNGRIHFAFLCRNLGMLAAVVPVICILAAPLVLIAFQLAR